MDDTNVGGNVKKGIGLGCGGCVGIVLFIIVLVFIGSIMSSGGSKKTSSTNSADGTANKPTEAAPQGKVEVKSDKQTSSSGYKKIVGEVINSTSGKVTYVKVTATYYDKDGKVTGTDFTYAGDTASTPLEVGLTAPFEITTLDQAIIIDHYKLDITWD